MTFRISYTVIWIGLLASAAPAAQSANDTTRFFESHPNEIDLKKESDRILFANKHLGMEFVKGEHSFEINRLYSIDHDHDYLATEKASGSRELFEIRMTPDIRGSGRDRRGDSTKPSLMGIMDEMAADAFSIDAHSATTVSWKKSKSNGNTTLHLYWNDIPVRSDQHLIDAEVTVTLRPGDPMSYWRINVLNPDPGMKSGLERIRFPLLNIAPIGDAKDNVYIYPRGHGGYVEDPFNNSLGVNGYYPLHFNMQFNALYNKRSGAGLYLTTQDSVPNLMQVQVANTPEHVTWKVAHFPPNITFAEESYWLPYDCVVGPFQGDWYDVAQIYRKWALKQTWCRKGPLRTRADSPKWYKESPFMFYTTIGDSAEGTHSLPENARIAADHFREFLKWADMPLPANWYSWKEYVPGMTSYNVPFGSHRLSHQGRWVGLPGMNIHDGNYPKIGSLEAYAEENEKLRREGGMVCPYVALEIFDQGPDQNSPYAQEARPHVVRDLFGVKRMWSNETAWQMCVATDWWQNRLEETCRIMTQREHLGGLYLDVMQGCGLPCYWTPHGHSASGGDAITTGMHELVERCTTAAKTIDPEMIITGENITENVIDVVDGTLDGTLSPENRAHVFAAVYQDFTKRYGTELSTGVGWKGRFKDSFNDDAFFLECASLFVQGAQIGRIRLRPRDAALSLSNPKQRHMVDFLNQVLGYYRNETAKNFHAYGQFMRPLEFDGPSPMPKIRYRDSEYRTIWNGIFRNPQGELGIFIANAGKQALAFKSTMGLARHGMTADSVVDVDRISSQGKVTSIRRGAKGSVSLSGTIPGRSIIMYHIKPADDQ